MEHLSAAMFLWWWAAAEAVGRVGAGSGSVPQLQRVGSFSHFYRAEMFLAIAYCKVSCPRREDIPFWTNVCPATPGMIQKSFSGQGKKGICLGCSFSQFASLSHLCQPIGKVHTYLLSWEHFPCGEGEVTRKEGEFTPAPGGL